jgi:uncharacterized protein DUF5302
MVSNSPVGSNTPLSESRVRSRRRPPTVPADDFSISTGRSQKRSRSCRGAFTSATEARATEARATDAEATDAEATEGEAAEAGAEAADGDGKPDLDETKRKFREALERKHQAHNDAQDSGGRDGSKISSAHGPAASRRSFRRKSG